MTPQDERARRADLLLSSPEHSSARTASDHGTSLARDAVSSSVQAWRAHRARQWAEPFPSPWRRIRSAIGLAVLVVLLGVVVAGLIGAALVAIVLAGSHLVG
jgi:hypothetical protein